MSYVTKNLISGTSLVGSSVGTAVTWQGGKTVLVLEATAFGAGVFLQMVSPSGQGINVNASTYAANQITAYDLPAGSYKMVVQSGTCTAMYAILAQVPYN